MDAILLLACLLAPPAGFDADFTGATLRLDLLHTGRGDLELFALDRARVEGEWPGRRTALLDDSNLGLYRVEVVDLETSRPLWSEGYCSVFGEWATTPEAHGGVTRTFAETLRLPEPRRPVQVRLRKRDARQAFREVWSVEVDPAGRSVERAPPLEAEVHVLSGSGAPAERVDLLLLGDGYRADEVETFLEHAQSTAEAMFAVEPFASLRERFVVRALFTPSVDSGISNPRAGRFRRTALGTSFDALGSERYVLTRDERWRDLAAAVPYDAVLILLNERQYGGGGIYRLYATAAAGSAEASYLAVHEFGHHFAGLADEYYTSPVAYAETPPPTVEPWEPNVTALLDAAKLRWADLVAPGTQVPTPWPKTEYEALQRDVQARRAALRAAHAPEEEVEALFREERAKTTALLPGDAPIGAYEGGMYAARGYYRPRADCLMFSRDPVGFCAVCARAIERAVERLAPSLALPQHAGEQSRAGGDPGGDQD